MQPLRLVIIGPGRAGGALGLASVAAGHRVVAVEPGPSGRVPAGLDTDVLGSSDPIPDADLLVIGVRDDAIAEVARQLAGRIQQIHVACHLSGLTPVEALASIGATGAPVGSFHPLQTLPDPATGAATLKGAWAAVGGDADAVSTLGAFGASLGMQPFIISDDVKPAYHAGAAAAANFVAVSLALAERLFQAAGVPFEAARPLTTQIVDNVFGLGSSRALTGPIVRGDVGTVESQLAAADRADVGSEFRLMARATARCAGTSELFESLLGDP